MYGSTADVLLAAMSEHALSERCISDAVVSLSKVQNDQANISMSRSSSPLRAAVSPGRGHSIGEIECHVDDCGAATPAALRPTPSNSSQHQHPGSCEVSSDLARKASRRLSWWAPSQAPEHTTGKPKETQNEPKPGLLARISNVGTGLRRVAQIAVDKLSTASSRRASCNRHGENVARYVDGIVSNGQSDFSNQAPVAHLGPVDSEEAMGPWAVGWLSAQNIPKKPREPSIGAWEHNSRQPSPHKNPDALVREFAHDSAQRDIYTREQNHRSFQTVLDHLRSQHPPSTAPKWDSSESDEDSLDFDSHSLLDEAVGQSDEAAKAAVQPAQVGILQPVPNLQMAALLANCPAGSTSQEMRATPSVQPWLQGPVRLVRSGASFASPRHPGTLRSIFDAATPPESDRAVSSRTREHHNHVPAQASSQRLVESGQQHAPHPTSTQSNDAILHMVAPTVPARSSKPSGSLKKRHSRRHSTQGRRGRVKAALAMPEAEFSFASDSQSHVSEECGQAVARMASHKAHAQVAVDLVVQEQLPPQPPWASSPTASAWSAPLQASAPDVPFGNACGEQSAHTPDPPWAASAAATSRSPQCRDGSPEIFWSDPKCNEAFQSGRSSQGRDLWLRPGHLRSLPLSGESSRSSHRLAGEPHLEPLRLEHLSRKRSGRRKPSKSGNSSRCRSKQRRESTSGHVSQPAAQSCDSSSQSAVRRQLPHRDPEAGKGTGRHQTSTGSDYSNLIRSRQACAKQDEHVHKAPSRFVPSLQVPTLTSPLVHSDGHSSRQVHSQDASPQQESAIAGSPQHVGHANCGDAHHSLEASPQRENRFRQDPQGVKHAMHPDGHHLQQAGACHNSDFASSPHALNHPLNPDGHYSQQVDPKQGRTFSSALHSVGHSLHLDSHHSQQVVPHHENHSRSDTGPHQKNTIDTKADGSQCSHSASSPRSLKHPLNLDVHHSKDSGPCHRGACSNGFRSTGHALHLNGHHSPKAGARHERYARSDPQSVEHSAQTDGHHSHSSGSHQESMFSRSLHRVEHALHHDGHHSQQAGQQHHRHSPSSPHSLKRTFRFGANRSQEPTSSPHHEGHTVHGGGHRSQQAGTSYDKHSASSPHGLKHPSNLDGHCSQDAGPHQRSTLSNTFHCMGNALHLEGHHSQQAGPHHENASGSGLGPHQRSSKADRSQCNHSASSPHCLEHDGHHSQDADQHQGSAFSNAIHSVGHALHLDGHHSKQAGPEHHSHCPSNPHSLEHSSHLGVHHSKDAGLHQGSFFGNAPHHVGHSQQVDGHQSRQAGTSQYSHSASGPHGHPLNQEGHHSHDADPHQGGAFSNALHSMGHALRLDGHHSQQAGPHHESHSRSDAGRHQRSTTTTQASRSQCSHSASSPCGLQHPLKLDGQHSQNADPHQGSAFSNALHNMKHALHHDGHHSQQTGTYHENHSRKDPESLKHSAQTDGHHSQSAESREESMFSRSLHHVEHALHMDGHHSQQAGPQHHAQSQGNHQISKHTLHLGANHSKIDGPHQGSDFASIPHNKGHALQQAGASHGRNSESSLHESQHPLGLDGHHSQDVEPHHGSAFSNALRSVGHALHLDHRHAQQASPHHKNHSRSDLENWEHSAQPNGHHSHGAGSHQGSTFSHGLHDAEPALHLDGDQSQQAGHQHQSRSSPNPHSLKHALHLDGHHSQDADPHHGSGLSNAAHSVAHALHLDGHRLQQVGPHHEKPSRSDRHSSEHFAQADSNHSQQAGQQPLPKPMAITAQHGHHSPIGRRRWQSLKHSAQTDGHHPDGPSLNQGSKFSRSFHQAEHALHLDGHHSQQAGQQHHTQCPSNPQSAKHTLHVGRHDPQESTFSKGLHNIAHALHLDGHHAQQAGTHNDTCSTNTPHSLNASDPVGDRSQDADQHHETMFSNVLHHTGHSLHQDSCCSQQPGPHHESHSSSGPRNVKHTLHLDRYHSQHSDSHQVRHSQDASARQNNTSAARNHRMGHQLHVDGHPAQPAGPRRDSDFSNRWLALTADWHDLDLDDDHSEQTGSKREEIHYDASFSSCPHTSQGADDHLSQQAMANASHLGGDRSQGGNDKVAIHHAAALASKGAPNSDQQEPHGEQLQLNLDESGTYEQGNCLQPYHSARMRAIKFNDAKHEKLNSLGTTMEPSLSGSPSSWCDSPESKTNKSHSYRKAAITEIRQLALQKSQERARLQARGVQQRSPSGPSSPAALPSSNSEGLSFAEPPGLDYWASNEEFDSIDVSSLGAEKACSECPQCNRKFELPELPNGHCPYCAVLVKPKAPISALSLGNRAEASKKKGRAAVIIPEGVSSPIKRSKQKTFSNLTGTPSLERAVKSEAEPSEDTDEKAQKKDEAAELEAVLREAGSAFAAIDRNRDGSVSKIELIVALKNNETVREFFGLPAKIKQEDAENRKALELVFQSIDKDGNKSLTLAELEQWIRENKTHQIQRHRARTSIQSMQGTPTEPSADKDGQENPVQAPA